MNMIKRIFVEKKSGFNTQAAHMLDEITLNLSVKGIRGLRILYCYDIENMNTEQYAACRNAVFADSVTDWQVVVAVRAKPFFAGDFFTAVRR